MALTVLVLLVVQPSLLGVANTSAVLCHWQPHNASSQAAAAAAAPSPATEPYGGVLLPSQLIAAALHNLATFRTATTQKAPATNTTWLQLSLDLEGALANLSPRQLQTLLMLHDKDLCAASDAAGPEGRALVLGGAKSRAVAVSGINMHVYDNADIVSGFLSAGTAWEAKEINSMLWALKVSMGDGVVCSCLVQLRTTVALTVVVSHVYSQHLKWQVASARELVSCIPVPSVYRESERMVCPTRQNHKCRQPTLHSSTMHTAVCSLARAAREQRVHM